MKRKLVLKTGQEFYGLGFGEQVIGKVVFNTSMVGYQEILTDKANYNKIVLMTYTLIGNYGINDDDYESDNIQVAGLIVKEYNPNPSNFRSNKTINQLLEENKKTILYDIDTREVSKLIRDNGEMLGMITDASKPLEECLKEINEYEEKKLDLTIKKYELKNKNAKYKIACLDLGAKRNIFKVLSKTFDVTVFPYNASKNDLLKYDGLFLAGGPEIVAVDLIKELKGKMPIFATGIGQDIVALAYGAKVDEMKFGHRGGNHTVKYTDTLKNAVIAQNHDYVVTDINNTDLELLSYNLLDNSIEGLTCKKDYLLSIQYNLDSEASPEDYELLINKFANNMEEFGGKNNAKKNWY